MPHTDPALAYHVRSVQNPQQIDTEQIRRKQKSIFVYKFFGLGFLVCIPIVINLLSRLKHHSWETPLAVGVLGLLALGLYRVQSKLRVQIETACHQLGPGVKLRKKYSKNMLDLYQIFQEGQRYYYIKSLQTGEKRLVPKEKILQDYDLAA